MQGSFNSELDAIIRAARRARAEEIHRLTRAWLERLSRLWRRPAPTAGR